MMLNCSLSDQHLSSPNQIKNNVYLLNIINYFSPANIICNDGLTYISSVDKSEVPAITKTEIKPGSIFVCTFCQVYASSDTAITKHIAEKHGHVLKEGSIPENYVSRLQALNDDKSCTKKVGRPRKTDNNEKISSATVAVNEEKSVSIPLMESDGLYWCQKCDRSFKKIRQISRHVCCEADIKEESLNESEIDDDCTVDFKSNMDIQPVPWKRVKIRKNAHVGSFPSSILNYADSFDKIDDETEKKKIKTIPNWRDDSSYIPLFSEESEKKAFEEHLSPFDYSIVDNLFSKLEQKSKPLKTKTGRITEYSKYSCNVCKKEFQTLSHMRRHCLIHTDFKPFTCPKCPYRSNVKASLYTHMRSHTGNMFRCSQCSYQSNKRSHLLDHMQIHSKEPMVCELCKNIYKTRKSLKNHVNQYHSNAIGKKYLKSINHKQSGSIKTKCEICNKTFTCLLRLKAHKQNDHTVIPSINSSENQADIKKIFEELPESDTNSENIPTLVDCSVTLKPLDNQSIDNLCKFACNICDQNFSSQSLLENHTLLSHCPIITMERLEDLQTFVPYSSFQTHDQSCNSNNLSLSSSENPADAEKIIHGDLSESENPTNFIDCSVRLEPLNDQLINFHQYNFVCNICDQKFSSSSLLENHTLLLHSPIVTAERLEDLQISEKMHVDTYEENGFNDTQALSSLINCSVRLEPLNDNLVELMLNNILQDKNPPSDALFDNVFEQPQPSDLLSTSTDISESLSSNSTDKKLLPINSINQFDITESSLLKNCHNKLNIDIIDECLRQSNITSDVISNASYQMSESSLSSGQTQSVPEFDLQTMGLPFSDTQLISDVLPESSMKNILQLDSELAESKSEEIKLFEKCRRAPAYVCCVCSSIFICSSTLKVHLKEHLNKSNENGTSIQQTIKECESSALPVNQEAIDDVCRILQGSSSSEVDSELEKLYTSSLHKMWNLKEFSVVLENDQSLLDAVLDDSFNLSIADKYEDSENLHLDMLS